MNYCALWCSVEFSLCHSCMFLNYELESVICKILCRSSLRTWMMTSRFSWNDLWFYFPAWTPVRLHTTPLPTPSPHTLPFRAPGVQQRFGSQSVSTHCGKRRHWNSPNKRTNSPAPR